MMKLLIIGSGGREHALAWALRRRHDSRAVQLYCAPGNAGMDEIAESVSLKPTDITGLCDFAENHKIDLTIVGGEAPLAAGITDEFARRNLKIVGPRREAAQLEASKVFAKNFMLRHRIPTARFQVAESIDEAHAILRSGAFGTSENGEDDAVVVKADGLAAGKGVVVARSRREAEAAVVDLMSGDLMSGKSHDHVQAAPKRLVIEEALTGREASLLLWTDGQDYKLMPAARDHKRIGASDTGPNTGGMGAVTTPDVLDPETTRRIVREIVEPTLQGARDEGLRFQGVLYVGLMLTADGARTLEYNVRFGDPEAQAILMRLDSDLVEICAAISDKRLGATTVEWSNAASACVVLAARGYPERPETGARIEGLEQVAAEPNPNVQIFHGATVQDANKTWYTAGGRVLGVTAIGPTLNLALGHCYKTIDGIHWDGMQYRSDIGK